MPANRGKISQQFHSKDRPAFSGSTKNGAGRALRQLPAGIRDWLARFSALLPQCLLRWADPGNEGGQDSDLATAVRARLDRGDLGRHAAVAAGRGERGQRPRLACLLRRAGRSALLGISYRVDLISARGQRAAGIQGLVACLPELAGLGLAADLGQRDCGPGESRQLPRDRAGSARPHAARPPAGGPAPAASRRCCPDRSSGVPRMPARLSRCPCRAAASGCPVQRTARCRP